jgi:hypothetical protein
MEAVPLEGEEDVPENKSEGDQTDAPKRAEDLLEPKAWSLNRLCVRTRDSSWSREFPIDRPRAQTLTLTETERRVDVRVVPCGPTYVVYLNDPTSQVASTEPAAAAAAERTIGGDAATRGRDSSMETSKGGGFKLDFAAPLLSLSFLAPPDFDLEHWNTASAAPMPVSATYHTLVETINTSLDDVRLSFAVEELQTATTSAQMQAPETAKRQSASLSIASFQVDNHMPFYDFPVVAVSNASSSSSLASVVSSSPAISCMLERAYFPVLHGNALRQAADDRQVPGKWCIEDLSLRFGKGIILNVEDAFVQHIVTALRGLVARSLELHRKFKEEMATKYGTSIEARTEATKDIDDGWIDQVMAMPFFLRNLFISKLDLELTLHARVAVSLGLAHTPLSFDEVCSR